MHRHPRSAPPLSDRRGIRLSSSNLSLNTSHSLNLGATIATQYHSNRLLGYVFGSSGLGGMFLLYLWHSSSFPFFRRKGFRTINTVACGFGLCFATERIQARGHVTRVC